MPRPNKLHDELDALLDGGPVELTEDLAPLVEAADVLRAELAAYELDPEVADRHLEQVLVGSATVVRMPVREQPNGWDLRRRAAAVVLAAALVLAPATMASAAALPGQPMYPFKLAIEQLRLASVQWSLPREAGERTRVADERLDELERLVEMKMFSQVLPAIRALNRAVVAATAAVEEAAEDGESVSGLAVQLDMVKGKGNVAVRRAASSVLAQQLPVVSQGTRNAIQAAVQQSEQVLAPPGRQVPSPIATPTSTPAPTPPSVSVPADPPGQAPTTVPPATAPPPTAPPPTAPPTTEAPTTEPPTTPPSTEGPEETPGSVDNQQATDGRSQDQAPTSTAAGP